MRDALVGFRIDGGHKLQRLRGERCDSVLAQLQDYLLCVSDARLPAYARQLQPVDVAQQPFPSPAEQDVLQGLLEDRWGEPCRRPSWSELFAALPALEGWHAGCPFMPMARLESCADVTWCFLIDLDSATLQIFIHRAVGFDSAAAFCTLPLAQVRQLTVTDRAGLHELLHRHAHADGGDPVLPLRDAVSAPFAGPGSWQTRLQLTRGRVRLLLTRGEVQARVRQVGALQLDDPRCGALLHAALAPAVRSLALAVYGPGVRLAQIAQLAQAVQQGALPALCFAIEAQGLPLLDLGLRPGVGLALTLGPDFFDQVRAHFLAAGMSPQGWRFLMRQPHAALRAVLQFFPPSARILPAFAAFINLLARAMQREPLRAERCPPALRGVERILDRARRSTQPVREENARIFLRTVMRATLRPDDEANLAHEAQDLSDFVYSQTTVLKGMTWQSLRRRSEQWHRALLIRVDPARDVRWPALLPRYVAGAYEAVELSSGLLLAEEGLEQRHCIGTYVNACSSGSTRVFSLRSQGRRAATMELQRGHDGAWRLVQIRGKANSAVQEPALLAAADAVVRAYAQAVYQQARQPVPDLAAMAEGYVYPTDYLPPTGPPPPQEHWTG